MGQLYYDRLTNNRIKNIVLGTVTILLFWLFMVYLNTPAGKATSRFQASTFLFILIGFSYLLRQLPFGQVIETTADKSVEIFYKLGALRLNKRSLGRPVSVTLEQDKERYYCLTLRLPNGQSLTIEKYPTLDNANERLVEFRKILD